jgi:hypothetical protein
MSADQRPYLNCPECQFTTVQGRLPRGTTCPRCRARGRRIELLVRDSLRASESPAETPRLSLARNARRGLAARSAPE